MLRAECDAQRSQPLARAEWPLQSTALARASGWAARLVGIDTFFAGA